MKTKLTSFVIFIFIALNSFAQAPNWSWAKQASGTSYDEVATSTTDLFGNLYIYGYTYSSSITIGDSTFVDMTGNGFVYIAKYSPAGNFIWAKKINYDPGTFDASKMIIDRGNNIYITANFKNTIIFNSDTLINPLGSHTYMAIVKMDSTGNVIWAKNKGALYCSGLTVDNNCNLYFTGFFWDSSYIFNHDTLINTSTDFDAYIAKIDSAGNNQWARSIKGNNGESGQNISVDNNNNIYACGIFDSPSINIEGTIINNTGIGGIQDIFLAKYSPNGNLVWAKRAGGYGYESSPNIKTDLVGDVYLTGKTDCDPIYFDGNSISNSIGLNNAFIAKYTESGSFLWAKILSGSDYKIINSISFDTVGNPYIAGFFISTIDIGGFHFNSDSIGFQDIFIAKLDHSGNALWAKKMGGKYDDRVADISLNSNGNIFATGTFDSYILSIGSNNFTNAGGDDIFIACMLGATINNNGPLCVGSDLHLFSSPVPGGTYSWTGPNGFTSSLQYPVILNANVTMSGAYALHVVAGGLPDIYDTTYVNVYPIPPSPVAGNTGPVCEGSSLTLTASLVSGAIYYWNGPNGFDTIGQNPVVVLSDSGFYYVSTVVNGCASPKDSTHVLIYSYPAPPIVTGTAPLCIGTSILLFANPVAGGTFSWTGPDGFTSADQNPIASDSATDAMTGYYHCNVTVNGCTSAEDSMEVIVKLPLGAPDICMVSTDSASGYNVVVWNKPVSTAIDHFNVYAEGLIAGVYDIIGSVSYDSLSVFMDSLSNPAQQAYLYKISVVDTCGIETDYSTYHKTIHLNINQGMGNTYNLIWNFYEGFTVPSYKIYRGLDPSSMSLMNIVSASLNSYTDLSPPPGMVYYQIESVNPTPCSPEKSNYLSTKSNIASPATGVIELTGNDSYLKVYPNPVKQILNIQGSFNASDKVFLYDVCDREIPCSVKQTQNVLQIDVSALSNGIYFLKMIKDSNFYSKKIIVNH